jgi:four helix bundle protein
MKTKEIIIQKVYELLKAIIPVLNKFPRSQKFTIADRIQNQISDLLELYIEAYYQPSSTKLPLLTKANIILEKLRHYIRLCYDLGLIHSNKYQEFAEKLNEIGRMTGGWIKSLKI